MNPRRHLLLDMWADRTLCNIDIRMVPDKALTRVMSETTCEFCCNRLSTLAKAVKDDAP